jgi:hypothetical protein
MENVLRYEIFIDTKKNGRKKILHAGLIFKDNFINFEEMVVSYLSFYFYTSNIVKTLKTNYTQNAKIKCYRVLNFNDEPLRNVFELHILDSYVQELELLGFDIVCKKNLAIPKVYLYCEPTYPFHILDNKIWLKWPFIMLFYCFQKKIIHYCLV